MDVTPHYRKAIREWIEWAGANCRFSEDNLLLPRILMMNPMNEEFRHGQMMLRLPLNIRA